MKPSATVLGMTASLTVAIYGTVPATGCSSDCSSMDEAETRELSCDGNVQVEVGYHANGESRCKVREVSRTDCATSGMTCVSGGGHSGCAHPCVNEKDCPASAPYCNGNGFGARQTCTTSCAVDEECGTGHYCDRACFAFVAAGASCGALGNTPEVSGLRCAPGLTCTREVKDYRCR